MDARQGVKCIRCYCVYGCVCDGEKKYCKTCNDRHTCNIICVCDVTGGLCASCLEVYKLRKGDV